jgi:hypothetical protein
MRAVNVCILALACAAALPAAARATCERADDVLCLTDGRFQVEADWRTSAGASGRGQAVQLTADSGTFWFFDPANLEMVVKVLDACTHPFDRFWVFASGLTDVEVLLKVTDTVTGEVQTYLNPMGKPYAPITDTQAFATCGEAGNATASTAGQLPQLTVAELPVWDGSAQPQPALAATAENGQLPRELWLGRWGRFVVTVDYDAGPQQHGRAGAVQLSPDSGYFWFFSPQNVEVAVKVLDACDEYGTFWIFASGLTDVGVTLRVRDDLTEEVKEYRSQRGVVFQPITDTEGLPVCP